MATPLISLSLSQMGTAIDDLAVTATAHGESQATDLEVQDSNSQSTVNPLNIAVLYPALLYSIVLYSILLYCIALCCTLF
jgi:hypothetical protein